MRARRRRGWRAWLFDGQHELSLKKGASWVSVAVLKGDQEAIGAARFELD